MTWIVIVSVWPAYTGSGDAETEVVVAAAGAVTEIVVFAWDAE